MVSKIQSQDSIVDYSISDSYKEYSCDCLIDQVQLLTLFTEILLNRANI